MVRLSLTTPSIQAGNGLANRKKPPLPEVPGDVFDRQRAIPGFDQGLVERQTCLVLGAGGIGQDCALGLARLGVKRIILVDCDVYEASNLPRQCLGSVSQVGMRKVDVAVETLQACHNLRSSLEAHHLDVVSEWAAVVSLAKRCDVVFNGIDAGALWDHALNGLCLELSLPLVVGNSVAWTLNVELYSSRSGTLCQSCSSPPSPATFGLQNPGEFSKRLSVWLAADQRQQEPQQKQQQEQGCEGGDAKELAEKAEEEEEEVATSLANFLSQDSHFRLGNAASVVEVVQKAMRRLSTIKRGALQELAALVCAHKEDEEERRRELNGNGDSPPPPFPLPPLSSMSTILAAETAREFLVAFRDEVLCSLLPGNVGSLQDLFFLPQPPKPNTRFFGSFVGPCLAAGALMVSQWCALITAPRPMMTPTTAPSAASTTTSASASVAGTERRAAEEGTGWRGPVSSLTFDLSCGLTAEEATAYEMHDVVGDVSVMNPAERDFALAPKVKKPKTVVPSAPPPCAACAAAARLRALDRLFVGTSPAHLVPVPGSVRPFPPPNGGWLPLPPKRSSEWEGLVKEAQTAAEPFGTTLPKHLHSVEYDAVALPAICAVSYPTNNTTPSHATTPADAAVAAAAAAAVDSSSSSSSSSPTQPSQQQHTTANNSPSPEDHHHLVAAPRLPPALEFLPLLKLPQRVASKWPSSVSPCLDAGGGGGLAVASGLRSALVKCRGEWFRLKGCGNAEQGFPAEVHGEWKVPAESAEKDGNGKKGPAVVDGSSSKMKNKTRPAINVRGCCFQLTADREAFMTHKIANLLALQGFPCGNISVGAFTYGTPRHLKNGHGSDGDGDGGGGGGGGGGGSSYERGGGGDQGGWDGDGDGGLWEDVAWPLPLVERHCGVFATVGDRRLGDHLLAGLEQLLPVLLPLDSVGLKRLRKQVCKQRKAGLAAKLLQVNSDSEPSAATTAKEANGGSEDKDGDVEDVEEDDDDEEDLFTTDMLPFLSEPPPPPADCVNLPIPEEAAPPMVGVAFSSPSNVGIAAAVPPDFAEVWNTAVADLQTELEAASSCPDCSQEDLGGGGCNSRTNSSNGSGSGSSSKSNGSSSGSSGSRGSLVFGLVWRLGYECGAVQRVLTQGRVSWGTYPDAMGTHCNAHANNMVVIPTHQNHHHHPVDKPPATASKTSCSSSTSSEAKVSSSGSGGCGSDSAAATTATAAAVDADAASGVSSSGSREKTRPMLAPVDFDMAFTQESYLEEQVKEAYPHFESAWEKLCILEAEGFYGTLAGNDFISTGVTNSSSSGGGGSGGGGWEGGVDQPPPLAPDDPRRVALRDTLCAAFRTGLAGFPDSHAKAVGGGELTEGSRRRRVACDALIRLSLILTAGVVA